MEQSANGQEHRVRAFVESQLRARAAAAGMRGFVITDETHMIDAGLIDSLGFLELVTQVEDEFGVAVDLLAYDPSEFATVGGFLRSILNGAVGP